MAAPVRVLVCTEIAGLREAAVAAVEKRLGKGMVELIEHPPDALLPGGRARHQLEKAEVLLADPGAVAGAIDGAARLRWLQSTWAGVNALVDNSTKRDYMCTRVAGCFGPLMAEYVLGYVLLHERRLLTALDQQKARKWDKRPFTQGTRPVAGLTLALIGCGDIGKDIARAAKAVGLRTVAFKRDVSRPVPHVDKISADLAPVLRDADFVVNTLPSTPSTRGILGSGALAECVRGRDEDASRAPLLINVGRGDVASESDLVEALDRGWISAAVLDVFEVEPLPASSPLWGHPKVIVTPHVSAVSFPDDVAAVFAENLERYTTGRDLLHAVAWEKGY
jgi:phosphoglycerate dehydrogenase-like enzyme